MVFLNSSVYDNIKENQDCSKSNDNTKNFSNDKNHAINDNDNSNVIN